MKKIKIWSGTYRNQRYFVEANSCGEAAIAVAHVRNLKITENVITEKEITAVEYVMEVWVCES